MSYIQDFRERLLDETYSQFANKPRIKALLVSIADRIQYIEDTLKDLKLSSELAYARGSFLDEWGEIVGEKRGTLSEEDYRTIIFAKILVNESSATIGEVLAIADALFPEHIELRYTTGYPAAYRIEVTTDESYGGERLRRTLSLLDRSEPAGVDSDYVRALPTAKRFSSFDQGFDGPGFATTLS